jgi:hypothetical protein
MSSQPSDLNARIALLKRDFPGVSSETIKSILSSQNYEVARARIHLALAKKKEQHEKAAQRANETQEAPIFESPFSISNRSFSSSTAPPPKYPPALPERTTFKPDLSLDSSIDSSHSDKPSSQISSQSSTLSNDLIFFYSAPYKSKPHLAPVNGDQHQSKGSSTATPHISPFLLSKGDMPSIRPKPLPNRQSSISELFKKARTQSKRQEGTQDSKKRMRDFFDDIDDIPESKDSKQIRVDVEVIDSDDDSFMRTRKRTQLSEPVSLSTSSSRLSQPIKSTKTISSSHTTSSLTRTTAHQEKAPSASSSSSRPKQRSRSQEDIVHLEPVRKKKLLPLLHGTEDFDIEVETELNRTEGGGNDSRSSDATVILPDPEELYSSTQLSFSVCSQMEPHKKHQYSRRTICEDSE